MDSRIHFLVTSARGKTRSFPMRTRRVWTLGFIAVALVVFSAVGWWAAVENVALRAKNVVIDYRLAAVKEKHRQVLAVVAKQEEQHRTQLGSVMQELQQRSEVIESIISAVGITPEAVGITPEIDDERDNIGGSFIERDNIGGPFVELGTESFTESLKDVTFRVDRHLDFVNSLPLGTPVPGTVTSPFGWRQDPFYGRPAFHSSLDIHNRVGTRIRAPAAGRVITSSYTRYNGNYLKIDHGHDFKTIYLHLQKSLVRAGELVERGQDIALLGNTGRSTGPHLCYTILHKGKPIDPYPFVMVVAVLNGTAPAGGVARRGQQVH